MAGNTAAEARPGPLPGSPGALFDPLPGGPVSPAEAPELSFGGEEARDRLLTPVGFPGIQALHATVQPGGHSLGTGYSWANLSADTPCEVLWVLSPPAI